LWNINVFCKKNDKCAGKHQYGAKKETVLFEMNKAVPIFDVPVPAQGEI
jgi:hypothetical protein